MKYIFPAVFTPIEDGSGYYVRVPDVQGCVTTGCSLSDAIDMITDALSLCLCALEDKKTPIPQATPPQALRLEPEQFSSLVQVDTTRYRALTDTRAVRKNVSIPAWMATLVDQEGLNCSQLLQEAIRQKLGISF